MVHFQVASPEHLEEIVDLLADDELGRLRENNMRPLLQAYHNAFNEITQNPHVQLIVGLEAKRVVAVAQLNILHYLTHQGSSRALIEGVRVAASQRGQGLGQKLFEYLIAVAKEKGCHSVQLTTDKSRINAHHFYRKLGFEATHEGFKLRLK